jgi:hypothetical protein
MEGTMLTKITVFVIALTLLMLPVAGEAQSGVRVIQDCRVPDIGITSFDNQGPVIYWNPCYANEFGPLVSAFYYQHELGHANLRTSSEDAADCYAVVTLRNTNPQAILAFIEHKKSQGWAWKPGYRPAVERAHFVEECFRGAHGH